MKVILIAGCAGSGKTILGEEIVKISKEKGMRALQTEYSKYLKLYAKEILGYDGTRENKPRKFLQDTGSYIRENLKDTFFFTRRMLEDFRIYETYFDIVVISDVRMIKEIEEIINSPYDVTTILVKNDYAQEGLTEDEKKHITEHEFESFSDYDYIIETSEEHNILNTAKKIVEEMEKEV